MLKNIEAMKKADELAIEKKKQRNKEMVAEVEKANTVALQKKQDKLAEEKAEDLAIVKYEAEKRAAIEKKLAEEKQLKDEKEREI